MVKKGRVVFYDTVRSDKPPYHGSMMILIAFLRSLLLTSFLSFAAPVFLFGSVLMLLYLAGSIPITEAMSGAIAEQILKFLAVFGNGSAVEGIFVISLTCALVGALFDTYAFYRHQNLRGG
jgi:hypothetical protein